MILAKLPGWLMKYLLPGAPSLDGSMGVTTWRNCCCGWQLGWSAGLAAWRCRPAYAEISLLLPHHTCLRLPKLAAMHLSIDALVLVVIILLGVGINFGEKNNTCY
jgi:hypothetical protein